MHTNSGFPPVDPTASPVPDSSAAWEALTDYAAGTIAPETRERFEAWLASDPAMAAEAGRIARGLSALGPLGSNADADEAYSRLYTRLGLAHAPVLDQPEAGEDAPGQRTPETMVRASISMVPTGWKRLSGISTLLRSSTLYGLLSLAVIVAGWFAGIRQVRAHRQSIVAVYTTGNAQRATVTLTDGSTVTLGAASRLEVPVKYSTGHRALRLEGEAFFNVIGRSDAPFTVDAGGLVTRVLGTQFVVRHYTSDSTTTVLVHNGKVAIRGTVLTALQRAELGQDGLLAVSTLNGANPTFETGVLSFDGMTLSDAIADLNRWYDVDVRLGDPSLSTRRLRGQLESGTADDLVQVLEVILAVRVVRDGRILTLYPRQVQ